MDLQYNLSDYYKSGLHGKIRRGWSKQIKSIENGTVKRRIKRSKDMSTYDIYDGLHPALVSEESFMKVQDIRLDKNRMHL